MNGQTVLRIGTKLEEGIGLSLIHISVSKQHAAGFYLDGRNVVLGSHRLNLTLLRIIGNQRTRSSGVHRLSLIHIWTKGIPLVHIQSSFQNRKLVIRVYGDEL